MESTEKGKKRNDCVYGVTLLEGPPMDDLLRRGLQEEEEARRRSQQSLGDVSSGANMVVSVQQHPDS